MRGELESRVRTSGRARVSRGGTAEELEAALRANIVGDVGFAPATRALYATDASNYRQVPIGVVFPKTVEDVIHTVRLCRDFGAPILSRGGGTSLAGQCCNVAVVIAWARHMSRVLEVNAEQRYARVWPGTILDVLRKRAEHHHLTFGPDPATHTHCTLGGMMGNNSCGVHAQMAGPVSHNVLELDVLTYDGTRLKVGPTSDEQLAAILRGNDRQAQIYRALVALRDRYAQLIRTRYPHIPRRISGYNLNQLLPENGFNVARALIGTESTCVTILEAKLRLVHSPPHRVLLLASYPEIFHAADDVPALDEFGPIALEGIDRRLLNNMAKKGAENERDSEELGVSNRKLLSILPPGDGFLMLEFGGETHDEAVAKATACRDYLKKRGSANDAKLFLDQLHIRQLWELREGGLGAETHVPGQKNTWPGWEDAGIPPQRLGAYLRDFRKLLDRYDLDCSLYGHFGQGCVHCSISFDLFTKEGVRLYRSFVENAADLVASYGGSLSGEHGDGQSRGELLNRMFGNELVEAFREFKRIWDPEGRMNPGKIVDPYPLDSNLRLGPEHPPAQPRTHFHFPDDGGSFALASERCVGVGKCRREEGGTMCPSYRATHQEMHTTRGRSHLLFEMLKGDVIRNGWRDDSVRESLDLCLACKGCKSDCPVNVDLATYKAEFLSHYFKRRLRPRVAYSMGLIMAWAPIASRFSRLANAFTHSDFTGALAKRLANIAPERDVPRFAPLSFQRWAKAHPSKDTTVRPRVLLWPDTFNNYFEPQVAIAATDVLEKAGFQVEVPKGFLCCGRPLYDFGMLPTAKAFLRHTLRQLRKEIAEGIPIVGLEPSCVSVFRDELRNLFPNDPRAERLRTQVVTLGEFFERHAKDVPLPKLDGKVIVHGHCHHKALFKLHDQKDVFERMGVTPELPDVGCCGMAGAFGYERGEKYEVGLKVAEHAFLPMVRGAPRDAVLVSDGFSCREQIRQETDRRGLHLAEVMQLAQRGTSLKRPLPERAGLEAPRPRRSWLPAVSALALLAGGVVLSRRRR